MKKKIIAVISAAVLALSCFATVSASSALEKANKLVADGVVNADGAYIEEDEILEVVELSADPAEVIAHLIAQYPNDKAVKVFEVEGDPDNEDAVVLSIVDSEIKGSKKYSLKVMNLSTGEWSVSGISVISIKAGIAKFNVTKAGAYALVQAKEAEVADLNPIVKKDTVVENKTVVVEKKNVQKSSPKTGEQ